MEKISVIIPAYCEEQVIGECYTRIKNIMNSLKDYDHEIVFVDDGSKDNTLTILKVISMNDKNVKVISFSRNFGHQCAISAGLKFVTGDAAIIIDADLQDPPELIPEMIKLWKDGNEIIYGKRAKRKGETICKKLSAKLYYNILNLLSDIEIKKDTGDFRLVDRKAIDIVNSLQEHNKFFRGLWGWTGLKQKEIVYERKERFAGKTKYPLRKMLKLAGDGILSFSNKPLKICGGLGIATIGVSIIILIYSILSYIFKWNDLTPGWTSIIVTITLFSGVQLLSMWVLSEYIARIYDESKSRPQYIIREKINID